VLFAEHLVVLRGAGDLGTGVALRLHRAGFPVVALELPDPLTIRRSVALSSAVTDGEITVEGMTGRRVQGWDEAVATARGGLVAVVVSAELPAAREVERSAVVDARLAKRALDTTIGDAPLVVGLGPGFAAGVHCHAVVETARGHHLGRVMWEGTALADTGVPGLVGGEAASRVVRAPAAGRATWEREIGDVVAAGERLGSVEGVAIHAAVGGVVRGLISPVVTVSPGLKVADVDPRLDTSCHEVSDKALAVGGGVLEAVLTWMSATR
jgi:xanthine dehydrogenase accessory factor